MAPRKKRKVTTARKPTKTAKRIAKATVKTLQADIASGLVLQMCSDLTKIRELLEALQLHIEPIQPGKKSRKKSHEVTQS
jgi:hypothetical protein